MNKEIIFCSNCKKIINKNMEKCNYCGQINLRYDGTFNNIEYNKNIKFSFLDKLNINKSKITIILIILINIILYFSLCILNIDNKDLLIYNIITYLIITIAYFYFICFQIIFIKANYSWYKIFIPIYNIYLYFELCTKKGLTSLILLIPYILYLYGNLTYDSFLIILSVSIILSIHFILMFLLANKFKLNDILFMLLFFIYIPIIAFNNKYIYN